MYLVHKFLFFIFLFIHTAKSTDPVSYFCNENSPTNASTKISTNIDSLLSNLVSGTVKSGFIATSYGEGKYQVYGLAQCRGDVSTKDCSSCIEDAAKDIRRLCRQADARIWYDYCFLRYQTVKFFDQVDTSGVILYNVQNVTDAEVFNKKLGSLMHQINSEAIRPASKGLGKGKSEISPFLTLYALVQCTRDLSNLNCAQCLATAVGSFPRYCEDRQGCRFLFSSCYVRYELYPFYFPLESNGSTVDHSSMSYQLVMAPGP